jgi:hypothetical protein
MDFLTFLGKLIPSSAILQLWEEIEENEADNDTKTLIVDFDLFFSL